MKVLLVNGSPHKNGCTYTALCEAEKPLREENVETAIWLIGTMPIAGCMDCGNCKKLHKCVIQDKVNEFREYAKGFDGYIFGSPVYFSGMNGSFKCFMDRLFFSDLWGQNHTFTGKPAAAVISARRAGFTETYNQIIKYFGINQMPIVTSTYWNLVKGMTPEEVLADKEGALTMYNLGKNMAYLLKCIDAGKKYKIKSPFSAE